MNAESLCFDITGPDGRRSQVVEATKTIWLGRDPSCDVALGSPKVSRTHLSLEPTEEGLQVTDHSSNGTLVNDKMLKRASILVSDCETTMRIGGFRIRVSRERPSLGRSSYSTVLADEPSPAAAVHVPVASPATRRRIHRQLLENLDLSSFDRTAIDPEAMRPKVAAALRRIVAELGEEASVPEAREGLVQELADEALGLGPLEQLLADPEVSEIMVVDPRTIFVERAGRMERTDRVFTDDDSVRAVIERIVTPLGRRIDESTPLVDARLRDGSRVNAIIPPLALRGPCITIRKFPKDPLGMADLVRFGSLTEGMAELLEALVAVKKNVVISGGTGSGKTTLLNVLSAAIPEYERIVTIEDAAELRLQQPHVVSLEARPPNLEGKGEYSIRDLVKNALRMRPDRIVVGECRGGEAVDMLQAMNTGHEGSLTTTHANSPREALSRIETLCLMAGLDLPVRAIRQQIASSVHVIVQQTRFSDGSRRVSHVAEVVGIDDDGEIELRDIFSFNVHRADGKISGEFLASGCLPSFMDQFQAHGLLERGVLV